MVRAGSFHLSDWLATKIHADNTSMYAEGLKVCELFGAKTVQIHLLTE